MSLTNSCLLGPMLTNDCNPEVVLIGIRLRLLQRPLLPGLGLGRYV